MTTETAADTPDLTPDEKTWGMLAHLLAFSGLLIPFGSVLAPLLVGVLKKDSDFVRRHAWSALNFQLNLLVHEVMAAALATAFVTAIRDGAMELSGVGLWVLALMALHVLAIGAGLVVLPVLAGRRARAGGLFRYPLTVRLTARFLKESRRGKAQP